VGRLGRFGVAFTLAGALQGAAARAALAQGAEPPPAAADPPPPAAAYPPPPRLQPLGPPGAPRVFLEAGGVPVRLQLRVSRDWQTVCDVPCGIVLDPSRLYRVGGGGAVASRPFHLPAEARDVVVRADAGSAVAHWTGLALIAWGAVCVGGGILYYATAGIGEPQPPHTGRNAVIAISIGAALELVGVPLWFSHTSVDVR